MNSSRHQPFVILALCLLSIATAAPAEEPAADAAGQWRTALSLGGDGYWRQRICIELRNDSDQPAEGQVVQVRIGKADGQADLDGTAADALRVVDSRGAELLWAVTGPSGQAIASGPLPAGCVLSLPAVCAAHSCAEYFVYFDNPSAWSEPDFLPLPGGLRNGGRAKVTVRAMPSERLKLRETNTVVPWPKDPSAAGWEFRCGVRAINTSPRTATEGLTIVDLSAGLARLGRSADPGTVCVMDGEKKVESFRVGDTLLFDSRVEPMTQHTFHVYFRRATRAVTAAVQSPREYAANPALPGVRSRETPRAVQPESYLRLLASPKNLIKNPDFESGDALPTGWSGGAKHERPASSEMGFSEPDLFGKRCVRLMLPASSQPQWFGWRQDVPVAPGKSYLLAAWLKCRDLDGGLQVHVHFRNARGELCRDLQMGGAGPAINGNAEWTLMQGVFQMPDDIATFQVHLTMLAHGTAWHDGLVLAEVTPGHAGAVESRSAARLVGPTVWPVNAMEKVFQDTAPRPAPARVSAARNEKEPLQLVLRSPRALRQVRVAVEQPVHANGSRLTDISVGVIGYVPVDHPTSYYAAKSPPWQRKIPTEPGRSDGWPGWWPDPILPRAAFDLAAQVSQPVWITIGVPKNAAAGDYHGKVRFVVAGAAVAETPFTVHVWDFALPDEMHIKAIFDCRQNDSSWAVAGKTPEQARRDFWQFMAQRRVCPDRIEPAPRLAYVKGHVVADFTEFDKAADYYFNTLKLPHSYTPADFYCFGWGLPPTAKFGEEPYEGAYPFASADRGALRSQFKQAYQACLKTFWDHIKAKGWERKFVLYISDEPFDGEKPIREQMRALCKMIHDVDPTIPIYCSTWHHQPEWDGYISVWGLGHYGIVPVDKLEQIRHGGATLWWTTDGQMCIDTPYCAVERLLPHYCFKYGAEAYEFWGIDWLTYNPYARGWHSYIQQSDQPGNSYYIRYPNGDGYLAYPGAPLGHAGPVTSIRLEQAREGCEDYEYLFLLRASIARAKQAGRDVTGAERILAQAQELVTIPNAGGLQSSRTLSDPDAVLGVKECVARAIEGFLP